MVDYMYFITISLYSVLHASGFHLAAHRTWAPNIACRVCAARQVLSHEIMSVTMMILKATMTQSCNEKQRDLAWLKIVWHWLRCVLDRFKLLRENSLPFTQGLTKLSEFHIARYFDFPLPEPFKMPKTRRRPTENEE